MRRESRTKIYVSIVALVAIGVIWLSARLTPAATSDDVEAAVFFCMAALIVHALAYKLPKGGFGDIQFIPLLAGVAVAPTATMVVGTSAALLVGEYLRRRETIRIVFNAAQLTIAVGLSVSVYSLTGGRGVQGTGLTYVLPFVAAFTTFSLTNAVLFSGVVSLSSGDSFSGVLSRVLGGASVLYDLVGMPLVLGFAFAYVKIGWAWSGALLLPLVGLRQVYKTNRELQTVNEELLQLMVASIEARDPYTSGHSQRVASYSRIVAKAAGLGQRAVERVATAALLHDVGKIHEEFAPILRKPGRLTDSEFAVMKTHSEKGARLVARVSQFEDLVPAVRGHHEAWDGSGYPDRLRGNAIPQWARVIAIADTVDAMLTDRPYRAALTSEQVRVELVRNAGRQFDPEIAVAVASDAHWPELCAAIELSERVWRLPRQAEMSTPRHSNAVASPISV